MVVNCHLSYKEDGGYCLYYWVLLLVDGGMVVVIRAEYCHVNDAWHDWFIGCCKWCNCSQIISYYY